MIKYVIFLAFLDAITAASQENCTQSQTLPLVELGGSSYYFETYFTTNYYKAMQFCRDNGMNLLSIESSEENTRILNYVMTNLKKIEHFWTSGSDLGEEGNFVWLSTGKSIKFTFWAPSEPNNADNRENCLEILRKEDKYHIWNDGPCENSYNFICEVKKCTTFCID